MRGRSRGRSKCRNVRLASPAPPPTPPPHPPPPHSTPPHPLYPRAPPIPFPTTRLLTRSPARSVLITSASLARGSTKYHQQIRLPRSSVMGTCRFQCRYPGCEKLYASTDAVRKHCRKRHPMWVAPSRTSAALGRSGSTPPPQPSVLRTKTNRCPPLFFYLFKVAPPPRRARGTRARITQAGSVLPRRVRLVRLALAAQEDFLYSCLGRHESI